MHMGEVVTLTTNGIDLVIQELQHHRDVIDAFVIILDIKERDGLLLDSGADLKTLCYMNKMLDQYINEEFDGETEVF